MLMLRNRSRAVTTKQALMADHHHNSLLSPTTKPVSSFLGSPRFFNGFLARTISDSDKIAVSMSPTSILDTKNSSSFVNPFGYEPKSPDQGTHSHRSSEQEAIGLALIDSIVDEKDDDLNFSKPINRMALLGSKLKVQIPVVNNLPPPIYPVDSPKSPPDFGIKTRNSQATSPFCATPVKNFARQLSLREMELSEDYTCVVTHGPNPKTTHIFDDCVIESSCIDEDDDDNDSDDANSSSASDHMKMECGFGANVGAPADFLSFCHTCKDILGQGRDIYIYRGEKAFCSHECRCQEMIFEGNPELDDDAF